MSDIASPNGLGTAGSSPPALESYALSCRRAGQPVFRCGTTWWREVRPCFFRPLLPFLDVPSGAAGLPHRAAFGGYQYATCAERLLPNSFLTYLVFPEAADYCLTRLSPRLRRYVRSAENLFCIRPFSDETELKAGGHSVYLEFQARTGYRYLRERVHKGRFDRWVDAEFSDQGLVALGAWARDTLVGVSLSRVIGDVWVYSTFFASGSALHHHVANLMLHHVRGLAAAVGGVTTVFAGMEKAGTMGASIDEFHLRRGAVLIRRPAVLQVNPLTKWILSRLRPDVWDRLRGSRRPADPGRPDARSQCG